MQGPQLRREKKGRCRPPAALAAASLSAMAAASACLQHVTSTQLAESIAELSPVSSQTSAMAANEGLAPVFPTPSPAPPASPVASLCPRAAATAGSWDDKLVVPQTGWAPRDTKLAVLVRASAGDAPKWRLRQADAVVMSGEMLPVAPRWQSQRFVADLSEVATPGVYTLEVYGVAGACVEVADDVYLNLRTQGSSVAISDIVASFFALGQRCGISSDVPLHHVDDDMLPLTTYDANGADMPQAGRSKDVRGGWHDASSTDKETGTVAGATMHLAYALPRAVLAGDQRALAGEVAWGAAYLLKLQSSDGSFPNSVQPSNPWDPNTLPRHLVTSADTGVTARAAGALAAAAAALADRAPATAVAATAAARRAWAYVQAHPDQFMATQARLIDFLGSAGSVLTAAVELFLATGESTFAQVASNTIQAGTFVGAVWTGAAAPFAGQLAYPQDERAGALVAMLRFYPHADASCQAHIRAQASAWMSFWRSRRDEAFGVVTSMVVPWGGGNGQQMMLAEGMMMIAQVLGDADARRFGQEQLAWATGRNPFGTSFVYGVGQKVGAPLFGRAAEASLGALMPGIMTTADNSQLTLDTVADYDLWRIGEASLEPTATMVHVLTLLHQQGRAAVAVGPPASL